MIGLVKPSHSCLAPKQTMVRPTRASTATSASAPALAPAAAACPCGTRPTRSTWWGTASAGTRRSPCTSCSPRTSGAEGRARTGCSRSRRSARRYTGATSPMCWASTRRGRPGRTAGPSRGSRRCRSCASPWASYSGCSSGTRSCAASTTSTRTTSAGSPCSSASAPATPSGRRATTCSPRGRHAPAAGGSAAGSRTSARST
mmetsp:Transcript_29540/g.83254  ORF Transcript_29540/g.83254 Transcript_29540/m.83254 type:complete len:202 (+) Transcript_29540:299-904(+)